MFMQGHFSAIWLRLLTDSEAAKRQAAHDLVELLARAVFIDERNQNWSGSNTLPTIPFQLHGRDYHALNLGKNVDKDTIEYIEYDYDGIELFVLNPDDPIKQQAPIAVRRVLGGKTDHQLLDLSRLSTSFLQEIHGRILQAVPGSYRKEHMDLRVQIQKEAAAQGGVS